MLIVLHSPQTVSIHTYHMATAFDRKKSTKTYLSRKPLLNIRTSTLSDLFEQLNICIYWKTCSLWAWYKGRGVIVLESVQVQRNLNLKRRTFILENKLYKHFDIYTENTNVNFIHVSQHCLSWISNGSVNCLLKVITVGKSSSPEITVPDRQTNDSWITDSGTEMKLKQSMCSGKYIFDRLCTYSTAVSLKVNRLRS